MGYRMDTYEIGDMVSFSIKPPIDGVKMSHKYGIFKIEDAASNPRYIEDDYINCGHTQLLTIIIEGKEHVLSGLWFKPIR